MIKSIITKIVNKVFQENTGKIEIEQLLLSLVFRLIERTR
jgi:hypothetical protein